MASMYLLLIKNDSLSDNIIYDIYDQNFDIKVDLTSRVNNIVIFKKSPPKNFKTLYYGKSTKNGTPVLSISYLRYSIKSFSI